MSYRKAQENEKESTLTKRGFEKKTFYFVNDAPATNREKSRARHFARRHIGRWTWERINNPSPGERTLEFDFIVSSSFNKAKQEEDRQFKSNSRK